MSCKRKISFRSFSWYRIAALTALAAVAPISSAHAQTHVLSLPTVDGHVDTFAISGTTLYIGGQFTTVGGLSRAGLAAIDLTTDTVIAGFNANLGISAGNAGASISVASLTFNASGNLWAAGTFDTSNGTTAQNIGQFNSSGAETATISNNSGIFNGGIRGIAFDASNNLYAVGSADRDFNPFYFGTYDPLTYGGTTSGLAEASAAGAAVTTFTPNFGQNISTSGYRSMVVSPLGAKLYIGMNGGVFTGGVNYSDAIQLNTSDGSIANDLYTNGGQVFTTKILNGSLYVGGSFTQIGSNATPDKYIAKLGNLDGTPTVDTAFAAETVAHGPSSLIRSVTQVGNDLYLLGEFTSYDGVADTGLAAINATTGAPDTNFSISSSDRFGGSGIAIAGFAGDGGTSAAIFASTGGGGNGFSTTVTGSDGVTQDAYYYTGITVSGGAASAPEPSAFALLASAGGLPIAGVITRRRRNSRAV